MKYLIISRPSLAEIIGTITDPSEWCPLPPKNHLFRKGYLSRSIGDCLYIVSIKDLEGKIASRLIVALEPILAQPTPLRRSIFQRIEKSAELLFVPASSLPSGWKPYHVSNRVSFFASANAAASSARWIVEIFARENQRDLAYWDMTTNEEQVDLNIYNGKSEIYNKISSGFEEVKKLFISDVMGVHNKYGGVVAQGVTLLNDIGARVVAKNRSYDSWLPDLTIAQRGFVESNPSGSISIIGAAGSGKTLCLALHAIYLARSSDACRRICLVTQNWSQAYMIDSLVQSLDPAVGASINTYPLFYLVRSLFPWGEREESEHRVVSEDSIEGKRLTFEYVKNALEEGIRFEYPITALSAEFRTTIDEARGSVAALNSLAWNFMNEFASVLSVNRIRPGVSAVTRYKSLPRAEWMLPLYCDGDREFVIAVYGRYVARLNSEKLISYDQVLSDYISKFDTFEWDRRRMYEGYDVVIIDEYHLYTEIERILVAYLYNDAKTYAKLVMASDPMQCPTDALKGVEFASERKEVLAANVESSQKFAIFKRYSRQIEDLVVHVYNSYPTLIDKERLIVSGFSETTEGEIPECYMFETMDEMLGRSMALMDGCRGGETQAIICLDLWDVGRVEEALSSAGEDIICLKSSADIDLMKYSKRRAVLTYAEMAGGLQFDNVFVIITSWSKDNRGREVLYSNRVHLTRLYLAITRATRKLTILVASENGGVPGVIESAVERGVLAFHRP